MKLVHPDFFFQIEFIENKVLNLIVESPKVFEKIASELYSQCLGQNGQWVLSECSTPIDIKKNTEIILNPFALDINNKRTLSKLYEEINSNTIKSDLFLKWNQLYTEIAEVTDSLIDEFDYHLEYDDEIEIKDLLKLINLRFVSESSNTLERMIDYINLHHSLLGTKVFILVNIKSFYSTKDLNYLFEQSFYKKYNLLLLECKDHEGLEKNEICYIIDKDECVIQKVN